MVQSDQSFFVYFWLSTMINIVLLSEIQFWKQMFYINSIKKNCIGGISTVVCKYQIALFVQNHF